MFNIDEYNEIKELEKLLEITRKENTNSGLEMWRKYTKVGEILNRIDLLKKKIYKVETMEDFFKWIDEH